MADQNPSTAALAGATSAIGLIVALGVDVAVLAGFLESSGLAVQHDVAALVGTSDVTGTVEARSRDAGQIESVVGLTGGIEATQQPGVMGGVDITGTLDAVQQGNTDALSGSPLAVANIRGDLQPQRANIAALAGGGVVGASIGAISRGARLDTSGAVATAGTEAATGQPGRVSIAGALLVSGTEAGLQAPNVGRAVGGAASAGVGSLAAVQRPNTASLSGSAIAGTVLAAYGLQLTQITGTVSTSSTLQGVQATQLARIVAGPISAGPLAAVQRPNTVNIVAQAQLYTLIGVLLSTQQVNTGTLRGGPIAGATLAQRQAANAGDLDGGPIAGMTLAARQAPNRAALIGAIVGAITGSIAARNVQIAGLRGSPLVIGTEAATQQPNTFAGLGDAQYGVDACYLIDEARPLYLIDHIACTCEC